MTIDVVFGGQGGDEGKGKIAEYLSSKETYDIVLRVSKPQAGHSIYMDNKRVGLATLPCGSLNTDRILIGRGAFIYVPKILKEIEITHSHNKIGIDNYATIVQEKHIREERATKRLIDKIGSVGTGAGPATRDKIMRKTDVQFAKDILELQYYLTDSVEEMHTLLADNGRILLEGDQGAKLDLIHGEYPFVTSNSTNVASLISRAGVSPREIAKTYLVIKPYTTRVAPGPLQNEILDKEILNWFHTLGGESGTISKRARRIGKFEFDNVARVIAMNGVTDIAVTHMDIFQESTLPNALGYKNEDDFLDKIKEKLCSQYPFPKISLLSYGPRLEEMVAC